MLNCFQDSGSSSFRGTAEQVEVEDKETQMAKAEVLRGTRTTGRGPEIANYNSDCQV